MVCKISSNITVFTMSDKMKPPSSTMAHSVEIKHTIVPVNPSIEL